MSLHVMDVKVYIGVLCALVVFTCLTAWVAFHNFDPYNDIIAIAIAATKTTLVVLFFMHVKYGTRLTKLIVGSSVVWLLILFCFTLSDYLSRGVLGVAGK